MVSKVDEPDLDFQLMMSVEIMINLSPTKATHQYQDLNFRDLNKGGVAELGV